MSNQKPAPDSTAVRVALWRALHVYSDAQPHVFEDTLGLRLLDLDTDWRARPDMDVDATRRARASIVARARFIEDLVIEQTHGGVDQYVILGAGLDTFAQRLARSRPNVSERLQIFEIDQPGPQEWKRHRLHELNFTIPDGLKFVPVDFEAGGSWWEQLTAAGFNARRPAVVAAAGVAMYLSREAILAMLSHIAALAHGSKFIMSFMLPLSLVEPEEQAARQATEHFAKLAGTPFVSFFTPEEMIALAHEAGLKNVEHVSSANLTQRYFAGRSDGLLPSSSEELLVIRVM